jgi:extracellular factor (EF) 3-hydroxypalmitic acid methyl ester biosynthesis protein
MSTRNEPGYLKPIKQDTLQLVVGTAPKSARPAPPASPIKLEIAPSATQTLLDRALDRFQQTPLDAAAAMYALQSGLAAIRSTATAESWQGVVAQCLAHPVGQTVWQDPFTAHSFRKPRGYSGDAELLDYLYGLSGPPAGTSPLGASIFKHMVAQQGGLSVRSRGEILADLIDETAALFKSPRILSIACGHLREGLLSSALKEGRLGELVALDQDTRSLAEVERVFAGTAVRTVQYSVRDILAGKARFDGYHFVYAAGLYDYLTERVAARLTHIMFDMLGPGGRLLVANFAPRLPEVAYMETFMDWTLIYRTPEQMATLSDNICGDDWKSHRLFWDAHGNIIFLDVVKRNGPAPVSRFGRGLSSLAAFGHRNLPAGPVTALPRRTAEDLLAT